MKALFRSSILLILLSLIPYLEASSTFELSSQQIQKLKDNIKKNPDNINSRRFLAKYYIEKSDWEEAVYYLSPVAENLPTESLHLLIKAYLKTKNIRQAESIITIPLSAKIVSLETYLLAAEVYATRGRSSNDNLITQPAKDSLFQMLKTAQQIYPNSYKIYNTWFKYLEEFVPHASFEGLKVLEDMQNSQLALKPEHYSLFCKYNHQSGFTKQTKESCLLAIEKDPSNPSNYIHLGQTHINTGNTEKGMRMLSSVGEKFANSEEALWATANAHYDSKHLPESYQFFKKAIEHPNAKPRDFLGFAKVAFELKKYGEALNAFDKHCRMTKVLDHEFRRSSGLLPSSSRWRERFRSKMMNCQKE